MPAAVAAPNALAVQAGLDVTAAGGGAVDAAVAAMAVAMSTEPGVVSPLGGAFVTVWPADDDPVVVDGNVEMPGRGLPRERFGQGLREITTTYGGGLTLFAGPGSVATPGGFAGLGLAHERWGRLPWHDVLAPAVASARAGFPLGAAAASYLALTGDTLFAWDPATAALLLRDGVALSPGAAIADPALADSLQHLADAGWRDLYDGDLARAVATDLQDRGGLLTLTDLQAYEARVRPALRLDAGPWSLATNAPPSIGGPVLTVMLTELARTGFSLDEVIRIQRLVLGHRLRVHDRSTDLERDGYALLEQVQRHGLESLPTSGSTAHVSVVDDTGTACSVTASAGYGSGLTVAGTGLMANNCLGEPELNRLGLHALAPGTRLASNMAPSAGRGADGEVLAIGTPGADRITTALLQVLGRHCFAGEDLEDAIAAPRLHLTFDTTPERMGDDATATVQVEDDPQILAAVRRSGLPAVSQGHRSMYFGGVAAAHRRADGSLHAAADLRRESATGVG
ncbi:gamma-glutamyltransferase [Lapillicoccus jejuensis]|uniref:Gamma-glutamyltranspeptidase/glutathione hydrolase n=1 Tax=Lapillicoccus jejuensis TaxID=402171 RepID=A0A542E2S8_9MICO|nr:gamma-glutamyltransferase [Lapillicoccus jejuensis]TQJ09633.1 gamma-glutamyltranspeptidase/glutathione hydrolase [Lapillicoccus jejuensis]